MRAPAHTPHTAAAARLSINGTLTLTFETVCKHASCPCVLLGAAGGRRAPAQATGDSGAWHVQGGVWRACSTMRTLSAQTPREQRPRSAKQAPGVVQLLPEAHGRAAAALQQAARACRMRQVAQSWDAPRAPTAARSGSRVVLCYHPLQPACQNLRWWGAARVAFEQIQNLPQVPAAHKACVRPLIAHKTPKNNQTPSSSLNTPLYPPRSSVVAEQTPPPPPPTPTSHHGRQPVLSPAGEQRSSLRSQDTLARRA